MNLSRIVELFLSLWNKLIRYALKFGVIGLLGYAIDVGIFNVLRLGVFGEGSFFQGPIGAKIISVSIATLVSWFGNRFWTFREHRRKNYVLELFEFAAVAVGGLGIGLLCLLVSHYMLGYQTLLADNISTNVIGLLLSTTFRFLLYRYWVYGHHRSDGLSAVQNKAEAAALSIFEDESAATAAAAKP